MDWDGPEPDQQGVLFNAAVPSRITPIYGSSSTSAPAPMLTDEADEWTLAVAPSTLEFMLTDEPDDSALPVPSPAAPVTPNYASNTTPTPILADDTDDVWDEPILTTVPPQAQEPSPEPVPEPQRAPTSRGVDMKRRQEIQAEQLFQIKRYTAERDSEELRSDAINAVRDNTDSTSYEVGTVPVGILEKIWAVRIYFDTKFKEATTPVESKSLFVTYLEFEFRLGSKLFERSSNREAIAAYYSRSVLNAAWHDKAIQPVRRYRDSQEARRFLRALK